MDLKYLSVHHTHTQTHTPHNHSQQHSDQLQIQKERSQEGKRVLKIDNKSKGLVVH